jgi:hypothetical protein
MNKLKKTLFVSLSVCILLILTIFLTNYISLQKPLSDVIDSDHRNEGIDFSVHYAYYVSQSTLVIDVKSISGNKSAAEVFRVLLQYAEKLSAKEFDRIELSSKGKTKFVLEGDYFRTLGKEYGRQNPVYTMRTFPENLYGPNGQKAFGSWTGGLLGVVGKQMEDFMEFHKQWYLEDMN